jgi:D-alanine-D-alanine ligase
VTAAGVLEAIDGEKFDVVEVGVTRTGQWIRPSVDPRTYSFAGGQLPEVGAAESSLQFFTGADGASSRELELLDISPDGTPSSLGPIDVVLPLLHGPFGEDGTLQGMLELTGVPYVGAGMIASAVGMDKHFMKLAFQSAGLQVGPWETVTARQWAADPEGVLARIRRLQLPVFVKPARAGSSVGITRVDDWAGLDAALAEARYHDPKIVVEEGLEGREIECGVLDTPGESPARASLLGEIVVDHSADAGAFYSFEAKYQEEAAADLHCPAELPDEIAQEIRRQAIMAFDALDCEGLCRADFFYTTEGEILINEVNTMPGFTPISMYPQVWQASGINFNALITELINLALQRPAGLR